MGDDIKSFTVNLPTAMRVQLKNPDKDTNKQEPYDE